MKLTDEKFKAILGNLGRLCLKKKKKWQRIVEGAEWETPALWPSFVIWGEVLHLGDQCVQGPGQPVGAQVSRASWNCWLGGEMGVPPQVPVSWTTNETFKSHYWILNLRGKADLHFLNCSFPISRSYNQECLFSWDFCSLWERWKAFFAFHASCFVKGYLPFSFRRTPTPPARTTNPEALSSVPT